MTCIVLVSVLLVALALVLVVAVLDTGNNGRHRRSLWRRIWGRIHA